jgi:hypothetical protein
MYAMIRRYRMSRGSINDLMHKVDTRFADRLQAQLGILYYQAIDTGDGTIMTVTVFEDEDKYRRSETAAAGVRKALGEFRVEEIDAFKGEVMVSRTSEKVLEPVSTPLPEKGSAMVELPSQLLGYIDPEFQKIALMSSSYRRGVEATRCSSSWHR